MKPAPEDIELASDAAHAAKDAWGKTSVTARSNILLKIVANLLAVAETWDNGKAVRETLNADVPLSADHFVTAGCLRTKKAAYRRNDENTVAYHFHEPLRLWVKSSLELPLLMARAGNWHRLWQRVTASCWKPAEQTPASIWFCRRHC